LQPGSEADSGLLASWWYFYIVASASGNAAFSASLRAEQIDQLLTANVVTRMSDIVGIPLAIIFMVVVRRTHENQGFARATFNAPDAENAMSSALSK
jgi:hypothetical protein